MKDAIIIHRAGKARAELGDVTVTRRFADGATREITPRESYRYRNHSPDGFEFGYGGSGPAQLALAILLSITHAEEACRHYQAFKFKFIAPLGHPGGEIAVGDIVNWLAEENRRTP